jgi:hypothetical protein
MLLFITGYAEAALDDAHLEPGILVLRKASPIDALSARVRELIATSSAKQAN